MSEGFADEFHKGDRLELVVCFDEHTQLQPGEKGTVTFVDDLGTVHVTWDNGAQLGMSYAAGDRMRKLTEA
jgi:Domain of unknown function (DUF4314)